MLARNPEAYRFLAIQFEQRRVNKIYRAVVCGRHNFEDEVIDLRLVSSRSGITQVNHRRGKDSETIVTTLKTFRLHTLVECKPPYRQDAPDPSSSCPFGSSNCGG